ALALAAEAEAQALANAGAHEAQLHRLQTDLQLREQQLIDHQHTTEEQDEQTMPPSMPKQQQDWATA
ncbi:hypothetical protein HaLaN_33048, partial [Haematococcus lacustris]